MKKNIFQLLIAGIPFLLFLLILYFVLSKKIENFDTNLYQKVSKLINPTNTKIIKIITFMGSAIGIFLGIIISCTFIKNNFDRIFLTLGMLGEVTLNNILKVIIKRPRPTINPLITETNYSFPSGHALAITAFTFFLLFFLWKMPINWIWKFIISIVFLGIIMLVMFSRVYLGVHYSSDVIAGFLCSASYILIITSFYPTIKQFFM